MMYGTHADITGQKSNEQAVLASRDQYQVLVSNIPGVTYRCSADEHRTMLFISDYIQLLSGYSAADVLNNKLRSYKSLIHPDDRADLAQRIDDAVQQKVNWVVNYRIMHADGGIKWVEERAAAEYDTTGQAIAIHGFIQDVSREKQLQERLVKLTQQLPGMVYQFQLWPDGRSAFPYASAAINKIYGVSPQDVATDASAAFEKIYPADLPEIIRSINKSVQHQGT